MLWNNKIYLVEENNERGKSKNHVVVKKRKFSPEKGIKYFGAELDSCFLLPAKLSIGRA